jgi:hypothetical protein
MANLSLNGIQSVGQPVNGVAAPIENMQSFVKLANIVGSASAQTGIAIPIENMTSFIKFGNIVGKTQLLPGVAIAIDNMASFVKLGSIIPISNNRRIPATASGKLCYQIHEQTYTVSTYANATDAGNNHVAIQKDGISYYIACDLETNNNLNASHIRIQKNGQIYVMLFNL